MGEPNDFSNLSCTCLHNQKDMCFTRTFPDQEKIYEALRAKKELRTPSLLGADPDDHQAQKFPDLNSDPTIAQVLCFSYLSLF